MTSPIHADACQPIGSVDQPSKTDHSVLGRHPPGNCFHPQSSIIHLADPDGFAVSEFGRHAVHLSARRSSRCDRLNFFPVNCWDMVSVSYGWLYSYLQLLLTSKYMLIEIQPGGDSIPDECQGLHVFCQINLSTHPACRFIRAPGEHHTLDLHPVSRNGSGVRCHRLC